jgi:hypothetical protein
MSLCSLFRECPNSIYQLCSEQDYQDRCKYKDTLKRLIEERDKLEIKPKYRNSFEQYPV